MMWSCATAAAALIYVGHSDLPTCEYLEFVIYFLIAVYVGQISRSFSKMAPLFPC